MINFIIVDELNFWLSLIDEKINQIIFNTNLKYHIYKFNDFNNNFFKLVFSNLENKVYILADRTKFHNGIEIAKRIRSIDKLAEIIFLSNSYDTNYVNFFLTSSIKAMGFIEKSNFSLLDLKLEEIVRSFHLDKIIKINSSSNSSIIKISDILYIESKNRKTFIHTVNSIIKTTKSLKYFENLLNTECDFFIRTHKACIVNIYNVINFNFKDKEIIFFNNKKCLLLSKSYKGIIKEKNWKIE